MGRGGISKSDWTEPRTVFFLGEPPGNWIEACENLSIRPFVKPWTGDRVTPGTLWENLRSNEASVLVRQIGNRCGPRSTQEFSSIQRQAKVIREEQIDEGR